MKEGGRGEERGGEVEEGVGLILMVFFFFQAEDGIRDWSVTGVQTCALPIYRTGRPGLPIQDFLG